MIVKKFIKGPLGNNNYVVIDEESHEAVLIDCSDSWDDVLEFIQSQNATLKYILLTHGHFDHFTGIGKVTQNTAKSYLHKADKVLLEQINEFMDSVGLPHTQVPQIDTFFDKDVQLFLGHNQIKIIETPGHTPGGVCFLIQNHLFSGDTLFFQTHGRTDLMFSDNNKMMESLKRLLNTLPDNTIVYPGHGKSTTIAHEKDFYRF
jgi:glyoxylase-like metal-dependent hydrolase (beta-lactamase superfamily II)